MRKKMNKEEYQNIANLQETHWWYQGMKDISISIIKKYLPRHKKLRILDVGCGAGVTFPCFSIFGEVKGLDISDEAIKFCHEKKYYMVKKGSAEKIPFPDELFDLVTCFDVLYHKDVKNDVNALREFYRVLRSDGYLLIREPVDYGFLSRHDETVQARQRYQKKELKEKIQSNGFNIIKTSYVNCLLYPFIYIKRKFESKNINNASDIKRTNPLLNYILKKILSFEGILLKKFNLPWGISIICLAQKVPSSKKWPKLPSYLYELYKSNSYKIKTYIKLRWRLCPFHKIKKYIPKEGHILDLGCGFGILSNLLAIESDKRIVHGVDISKKRIYEAKKTINNRNNINFDCDSLIGGCHSAIDLKQYNSIIMSDFMHHLDIKEQKDILKLIYENISDNTQLFILDVNKNKSIKYHLANTADLLLNRKKSNFRSTTDWSRLLKEIGFNVAQTIDLCDNLPFSDFLMIAKR